MRVLAFLLSVQWFFLIYLLVKFCNLKSSVNKAQNKTLSVIRKNQLLLHTLHLSIEKLTAIRPLPFPLTNISFADETGVILSVKKIKIPSISAPYNAAINLTDHGYLLFFRYDTPRFGKSHAPFFSNMGCIHLDHHFEPLEKEPTKIETNSMFSEDARFFQNDGRHFLIYNDLVKDRRGIRIAGIDIHKRKIEYVTALNLDSEKAEKNWTPFSYAGQIHFLYEIHPQKVFSLPDPRKNLLKDVVAAPLLKLDWPHQWGPLRGGTPALLVDGEYLAFFHSSFEDCKGTLWYIMGAYTFASTSPFQVTRISPYPILFKGIYDTTHQTIANPRIRSIYPVGFVHEQREGRDLIHVSCGENDSETKILTMDKRALLASLKEVGPLS